MPRHYPNLQAKLESNMHCIPITGCWLYNGSWSKYGYGTMYFEGGYTYAHRASYLTYKGKIPKRMVVMHKCDTPACFNPDHLVLATYKQNTADMFNKGRANRTPARSN